MAHVGPQRYKKKIYIYSTGNVIGTIIWLYITLVVVNSFSIIISCILISLLLVSLVTSTSS